MHEMTPPRARESFATLVVGGRRPEDVVPVRSVEEVGSFDMGPASAAARAAVLVTCAMLDEVLHP
ncbi:MAG TPA: hypothetical protein VFQ11_10195 [Nocardioidaceae bacterium]|jgi:hypothetical protein|nr:hypothetical protein [Nocardioidaceae bacterium]